MKYVNFNVKPMKKDSYFGFSLSGDHLHLTPDGIIHHNSGKSVLEQNIVNHVSHFSDDFQLVGVDVKVVEFNLLKGVKGVKGVALDVKSAANAVSVFQNQMMRRFKFMAEKQANNVHKIKNVEVDYYELWGKTYQFDEMFELKTDLDEKDRDYSKLILSYPDGRLPKIISIEEIYEGLENNSFSNPSLPQIKGYSPWIKKGDIVKTKGTYRPKTLLLLIDEMNELMNGDDYKSVDTIKQGLGSIARLGRAADVHLALAMQRASGGTVSSDLMNNIQQTILLGAFDSGSSTLLFEKDISNLAKPEIKGRAFMQVGKREIYEVQTYWIEPEKVWVFDEERKDTYENKVYLDQCELLGKTPDDTGWVDDNKNEIPQPDVNSSENELQNNNSSDTNVDEEWEDDENWDEDIEWDDEEEVDTPQVGPEPSILPKSNTISINKIKSEDEDNKTKPLKFNFKNNEEEKDKVIKINFKSSNEVNL